MYLRHVLNPRNTRKYIILKMTSMKYKGPEKNKI